jgi:hypothetical protein
MGAIAAGMVHRTGLSRQGQEHEGARWVAVRRGPHNIHRGGPGRVARTGPARVAAPARTANRSCSPKWPAAVYGCGPVATAYPGYAVALPGDLTRGRAVGPVRRRELVRNLGLPKLRRRWAPAGPGTGGPARSHRGRGHEVTGRAALGRVASSGGPGPGPAARPGQ